MVILYFFMAQVTMEIVHYMLKMATIGQVRIILIIRVMRTASALIKKRWKERILAATAAYLCVQYALRIYPRVRQHGRKE